MARRTGPSARMIRYYEQHGHETKPPDGEPSEWALLVNLPASELRPHNPQ